MGIAAQTRIYLRRVHRRRSTRLIFLLALLAAALEALYIHQVIADGEAQRSVYAHGRRHLDAGAAAEDGESGGEEDGRRTRRKKFYITGLHFNNAKILRSHWNDAVAGLADEFGAENVFVSVSESGSWDGTKAELARLDRALADRGVRRRVEVSDVTHQDEMDRGISSDDRVETPGGERRLRRIPYLAALRNRVLEDLARLADEGEHFDMVLFLNDVVFTTDDVLDLLDTNGGDFAAACSLDFSRPPAYYDTFALRDSRGRPGMMLTWPYFRAGESRDALVTNRDAVPVRSCWNGIVAMPAAPFISSTSATAGDGDGKPLRFRGIPNSLAAHHLEGSECCLIHADNPLSQEPTAGGSGSGGVYLNPRVRVGYTGAAYDAVHPAGGGSWVPVWRILAGTWAARLRGLAAPALHWLADSRVRSRLRRWERDGGVGAAEPGWFCLINEMQVLAARGWQHV